MNRARFKFRVWDERFNNYIYNTYISENGKLFAMSHRGTMIPMGNDKFFTIEQCTGLTDKNGTLIFEGDIIKVVDGCVHLGKTFEVVGCMMIRWEMRDLSNDEYDTLMVGSCVEIIGTIHDAPDMKDGSKDQFREVTKKVEE